MQELKFIEDRLNNLCSEHDELMTVLQIYDFIPNIKSWQLLNKNISSKISMYEQQIEEMQSHHSRVQMRQQIHEKSIHDDAKISISIIEKKMNQLKTILDNQQSKLAAFELRNTATNKQNIQCVKKQVQGKLNQHYKQLNSAIVEYKTSLQLAVLEIKELNVNNAGVLEKYTSSCLTKENYEHDKLAHQIELFKLELGKPDFKLFFDFTYNDIKQSIQKEIQYISLSQKLLPLNSVEKSRSYKKETFNIVYNSYLNLFYRIRGMKNAAANELLMMYAEQQNKMGVNKLQKRINQGIRDLEDLAQLLQDRIQQFRDTQQL